ncbi:hypothetical protein GCK32_010975 [Trichostrongylus colubriformis]|uniref:Uncharacterized protein n=1 Tax=Trichostrongylus colubriformis TaxID=6319 RepID=A0AAN8F1F7_TRICO
MCLEEEERKQRKAQIECYLRMRNKLLTLQLTVLKLKKKLKPEASPAQSRSIDQSIEIGKEEYQRDVEEAESLFTRKLTPVMFMSIIKHRQQKVYHATEQCSDAIKRLLMELSEQPRESEPDREAVRMHTKTLNEGVTNDMEDIQKDVSQWMVLIARSLLHGAATASTFHCTGKKLLRH